VTSEELAGEREPYAAVVPYSTWDVEAWSVIQVMVAEVAEIAVADTDEITGGTGLAFVANVKFVDVARVPAELAERTAKL
jgi:hypothetical protein